MTTRYTAVGAQMLCLALERSGVDPAPELARHRLRREQVFASPAGISPSVEVALYRGAIQHLGLPTIGLAAGELFGRQDWGLLWHYIASMPTLREALYTGVRAGKQFKDSPGRLRDDGRTGRYELLPFSTALWIPPMAEARLRSAMNLPLHLSGKPMPLLEVHHAHPAPAYAAELERSYGAPVKFDQPVDALIFDAAMLARSTLAPNASLAASLGEVLRGMAAPAENSSWTHQVEQALVAALALKEVPEMGQVAALLGISERSLRLKLAEEGTSFTAVLDALRRSMAMVQLHKPNMTVDRLAEVLGYQDPRQFYRRFREWTGCTPAQWFAGVRSDPTFGFSDASVGDGRMPAPMAPMTGRPLPDKIPSESRIASTRTRSRFAVAAGSD